MREMVNKALVAMNGLFADMYEVDIKGGRRCVSPEKLLRAMLLQVLYSVHSEGSLDHFHADNMAHKSSTLYSL